MFGKKKNKYYDRNPIMSKNCTYNLIIGKRSNGKTYSLFQLGLEQYVTTGAQMALVRRWREDFVGKRGTVMFDALVNNKEVEKLTKGEWTGVSYYASKWYLSRMEDGKVIKDEKPFCFAFSLSEMEHDKSTSYPGIKLICFDEFISRMGYLTDEFVLFCNVVSTIIRDRTDVKIFMLGNTVNKYCPYFNEMGLNHIRQMKPGDIDIYTYGDSQLRVAVEYCSDGEKQKKNNDYYFAFDNPKLKMITSGAWEIDVYPHLPIKYKPKDIVFTYFIEFNSDLLQCEVIQTEDTVFTYIHKKTTPLQDPDHDIIYSTKNMPGRNYRKNLLKPVDPIDKRITNFFYAYKVFYQDNEIGEIVRNYILWCKAKGG